MAIKLVCGSRAEVGGVVAGPGPRGGVGVGVVMSMGFSRQEHWSELPFPLPGDLLHPGIEPGSSGSLALQVYFLTTKPSGKPKPPL